MTREEIENQENNENQLIEDQKNINNQMKADIVLAFQVNRKEKPQACEVDVLNYALDDIFGK